MGRTREEITIEQKKLERQKSEYEEVKLAFLKLIEEEKINEDYLNLESLDENLAQLYEEDTRLTQKLVNDGESNLNACEEEFRRKSRELEAEIKELNTEEKGEE